jgi:CheY-like chemotaxis protein
MHVNKVFLVIDDSYIDRLVSSMLIKRTYNVQEVHEVTGAKPALEWLMQHPPKQDEHLIILLDIMMPQLNGFDFLDQFDTLHIDIRDRVSIIMLSSTLDHDDIKRAKGHPNVKKLLSKPLSANELKEFIV